MNVVRVVGRSVVFRHVARAVGELIAVSLLAFAVTELAPGDAFGEARLERQLSPAALASMRSRAGLDRPFLARYAQWLDSVAHSPRNLDNAGERKAAFLVASERCAQKTGQAQNDAIELIERELDVEPFTPGMQFMMSWDQVRSLRDAGHIVGSHTLSHPNLAHITKRELAEECRESKKRLEAELGAEVIHFSYPSPILQPHWTERTITATEDCGYQTAVTSTAGVVRGDSNPFRLQRMAVPHDQDEFLWTLQCTLLGRRM